MNHRPTPVARVASGGGLYVVVVYRFVWSRPVQFHLLRVRPFSVGFVWRCLPILAHIAAVPLSVSCPLCCPIRWGGYLSPPLSPAIHIHTLHNNPPHISYWLPIARAANIAMATPATNVERGPEEQAARPRPLRSPRRRRHAFVRVGWQCRFARRYICFLSPPPIPSLLSPHSLRLRWFRAAALARCLCCFIFIRLVSSPVRVMMKGGCGAAR
jgi:hypothetical protein